jgi:hypothetical protein
MTTLHTFGCSITQGFALPDIVRPALDAQGQPLTDQEVRDQGIHWTDIHILAPSAYAWPSVLANQLNIPVLNHARRGACFQQIARQCAVHAPTIQPQDTVIVMWTYLSRISLQWPARTSVPFCNIVDPNWGWRSIVKGFNTLLGLTPAANKDHTVFDDQLIHDYIHQTAHLALDPMGVYNRYYNNLVLLTTTDGLLRATGARVIHLSVEPESYSQQLESARRELDPSLREPYAIPDPASWYTTTVDHDLCTDLHDPSIPPAENDMHPSVTHHKNFARTVFTQYFKNWPMPCI